MTNEQPRSEGEVLRRIDTAIEEVVRSNPRMGWREDGNNVRRQKYIDNVVSEFTSEDSSSPLTRSWFKYGAAFPMAESYDFESHNDPSPVPSENELEGTSFDDVKEFLLGENCTPPLTPAWWNENIFDFLEEYYTHKAPPRYRDLYLENVRLRKSLDQASDKVSNNTSVDCYDEVLEICSRFRLELASHEEMAEALGAAREVTNRIEDCFMLLTEMEPSEYDTDHLHAINQMERVFDGVLWEYPAARMSESTVEGPNAELMENVAESQEENWPSKIDSAIEELQTACIEANLVPSVSEFDRTRDDVDEAIEGVLRLAQKNL